ncbi:MAG: DUF1636 domain-containing protein [Devosiaceae bacterium]|nr:DUF1636 domain-containing protein [Devosiaceae bacterium MH13]
MEDPDTVCLSVCTRCKPSDYLGPDQERPGYLLAGAVLDAVRNNAEARLTLRGVRCMSQCKRPCAIALSAPGKYTLLFGDLDPESTAADILTLAHQYAASPDGLVPRDERREPLRAGILGRIPPLGYAGEAIDHTFNFTAHASNQEEIA